MAGSYPQQFSAGVFYVPPPQTQGNAFSAAWHGWHQVRSPYAQAMFNARLAALDPSAQYKLLESLYERRAQMLEQAASLERAAMQAQSNAQSGSDRRYAAWVAAQASMTGAFYGYRAQRERGELDLQGEIMKAGHMEDNTRAALEEYEKSMDAVATAANQGRADDAAAVMEQALNTATARIESLRKTDPMQADALARAVRGTQLPINDNELEQALSQSVEASIPSAPNYSTTRPGQMGRPAELPFYDPAATVPPNGSGQAPPPATGRQPVSTGGGTTAPAPSSAAPAAPVPPYGSTASSTTVRTSGASPALTAQMLAAAAELSGDIQDVRAGIPNARSELGGFYDPIPGTPARGGRRAKRSEIIAQDLAGPGRSMRVAATPAPRPTFAPLTPSAQSGTVAAKGEPVARSGGGGVADGLTTSVPGATGSPVSPPAPQTPAPRTPAAAPVTPDNPLLPPPPPPPPPIAPSGTARRAAGSIAGGARPQGTPLQQAQRVAAAMGAPVAEELAGPAPTAPIYTPVFRPELVQGLGEVNPPPRPPPVSTMDRVWTGDRWWDREQFVQQFMERNRSDRAYAEVKWAEFAAGYMDQNGAR